MPPAEESGAVDRARSFVSGAIDPGGVTYLIQASVMGGGTSVIFLGHKDHQPVRGRLWDPVNRALNRLYRSRQKSGEVLLFVLRQDDDADPVLSLVMPNMPEARRKAESIAADITAGHFDPAAQA